MTYRVRLKAGHLGFISGDAGSTPAPGPGALVYRLGRAATPRQGRVRLPHALLAKRDVELPAKVPSKRRHVEKLLDVHIATWLSSDTITDDEHRRLSDERERRRRLAPDYVVGVLVGEEGVTPSQLQALHEQLLAAAPTEIHHPRTRGRVHGLCRSFAVPVVVHRPDDLREVVRHCQLVIAAPKEPVEPLHKAGVWDAIRYAKHRSIAVRVIPPTAKEP